MKIKIDKNLLKIKQYEKGINTSKLIQRIDMSYNVIRGINHNAPVMYSTFRRIVDALDCIPTDITDDEFILRMKTL